MPSPSRLREGSMRLGRLVGLAVTVTFGLAALAVGLPWLVVITPRWLIRVASISFLWSYRAAARARRRQARASFERAMRGVLLAWSGLASVIVMEVGSEVKRRWSERIPTLPTRFEQSPGQRSPGSRPAGSGSPAVEGI